MLSGSEHTNIDTGSNVLLGSAAGIVAFIVVFLLYANKRRWFPPAKTVSGKCESFSSPRRHSTPVSVQTAIPNQPCTPKKSVCLAKRYPSLDGSDSSSETESLASTAKVNINATQMVPVPSMPGFYVPVQRSHRDLMSLVEKGKVAISSNSSCCSSTTSSIGDRHANLQNNNQHTEVNHTIITHEIRETKIDNHDEDAITFAKDEITKCEDDMDVNSNRDCIVIMNTEPFDAQSCISNETDSHSTQVNKCGNLEIALLYDAPMRKMTVHVLQARNMPTRECGQPTHTQVRLLMLPSKKQKHKTKIRSGENPQYMESFLLHKVNPEDVNSMGLRLRVYGCEKMRRERLVGESVVSFAHINLELENNLWLNLEPRANASIIGCTGDMMSLARSDSTSSTHSMQHGGVPELLLGLAFNAVTGGLSVEVVKGSHFRNLSVNRAPDTYVKLSLVSSTGQELAHSKTSVQRGQPNPLFKETFIFQVALFQLADVTLVVSVYNRRGVTKRKEMLGWFSLGLNSSGAEELAHWMDMKDVHQEQICRWHILVDS